jgi:hypothetical protein
VILPLFLPCVPSFNRMLKGLEEFGDFLLQTLEVFSPFFCQLVLPFSFYSFLFSGLFAEISLYPGRKKSKGFLMIDHSALQRTQKSYLYKKRKSFLFFWRPC